MGAIIQIDNLSKAYEIKVSTINGIFSKIEEVLAEELPVIDFIAKAGTIKVDSVKELRVLHNLIGQVIAK